LTVSFKRMNILIYFYKGILQYIIGILMVVQYSTDVLIQSLLVGGYQILKSTVACFAVLKFLYQLLLFQKEKFRRMLNKNTQLDVYLLMLLGERLSFAIKKMIKTVIFDMDRVIVDTEPVH